MHFEWLTKSVPVGEAHGNWHFQFLLLSFGVCPIPRFNLFLCPESLLINPFHLCLVINGISLLLARPSPLLSHQSPSLSLHSLAPL
jgi:hypothetical protein